MSSQGTIRTTYRKLLQALGRPLQGPNESHDGNVSCEWRLLLSDEEVTVYDWKEGRTPMAEYDWHIGGSGPHAVAAVKGLLKITKPSG
jgi:hypothetical protein